MVFSGIVVKATLHLSQTMEDERKPANANQTYLARHDGWRTVVSLSLAIVDIPHRVSVTQSIIVFDGNLGHLITSRTWKRLPRSSIFVRFMEVHERPSYV